MSNIRGFFVNNPYESIAIVISTISLLVSIFLTIRANNKASQTNILANKANKIAKESNQTAEMSNLLAIESNQIANNANELVKQTGFSEYYNNLYKINQTLSKVSEYLTMHHDLKKAVNLIRSLSDVVSDIAVTDSLFPLPAGSHNVFSEIHDECIKIKKNIDKLGSLVIRFNDNYNYTDNDSYLIYSTEKLDSNVQKEYYEKVDAIEFMISRLFKYINSLIDVT